MTYHIKGLEYLGTQLKSGTEAKRFVILGKTDTMPTPDEVKELATANPKVKKAWVMEINGNKWKKVMDTIDL